MWQSLPEFGTGVLYAIVVAAAYTFALAIMSGGRRPRLLQAARLGSYGTIALVGLAVLVLAYAFVSHDFRLQYVIKHSDRTMSTPYLIAALWGGQDGSLLWWLFLSALFSGICVAWMRRRYLELQPYVLATLMTNLGFFALLMIFAANPFSTSVSGAPADGDGLNQSLRNFYMIIHPPSLYVGFTSASIPFAFAIAALVTGRLNNEWIVAVRKWMLFSWLFLSIGNTLGMLWAYEELGWGGPWAWDPVENAAFLPWLTASAYVHSTILQERRGMLKVWNLVLICTTYFLTIFGTFLTRSGLIASVHSFAQTGIGTYFLYYMGVIVAVSVALIVYRLPQLRSEATSDSILSRESAFVLNNWGLLSLTVFIVVATIWPRISEWLMDQKSTLGPTFYNTWIPPVALVVFGLMGAAPLLGWRKSSRDLLLKSFRIPVLSVIIVSSIHIAFGKTIGFAPFIQVDPIYSGAFGATIAKVAGTYPFFTIALCTFNIAVVLQEFWRGTEARRSATNENVFVALFHLVSKSRRRYGGYVVHLGIALMFIGFAGRGWGVDKELSMKPGDQVSIEEFTLQYAGPRMDVDEEKRMIFADVDVQRYGKPVGRISPAQYIYMSSSSGPQTKVARYVTWRNDLYMIIGMVNPQTKIASFQFHVNNLISFIWVGGAILVLGAMISFWPDVQGETVNTFGYVRAFATILSALAFGIVLAAGSGAAYGQAPMQRTGIVGIQNETEKQLFSGLLCTCGCPREALSTCTCDFAHQRRAELRSELQAGKSIETIQAEYVKRFGTQALAVPPNTGTNRLLLAIPIAAISLGAIVVVITLRKWKQKGATTLKEKSTEALPPHDDYDDKLDNELKSLD